MAAIPRRPRDPSLRSANSVQYRLWTLIPCSYTWRNSARRRIRSAGRKSAIDTHVRPLLARDCQALPPLGAAPLQNQSAILAAHPDEKSVRTLPAACIGLKRAFTFHRGASVEKRTLNVSEAVPSVSIAPGGSEECQSRPNVLESPSFTAVVSFRRAPCTFGLSPKFSTPVEKTVENRRDLVLFPAITS